MYPYSSMFEKLQSVGILYSKNSQFLAFQTNLGHFYQFGLCPNASQAGLRASQAGFRARQAGLRASQPGLRGSEACLAGSEAWLDGSKAYLACSWALKGGNGWIDRWTDGRMDGRTNRLKISPFYRTLSPIGAAAPL